MWETGAVTEAKSGTTGWQGALRVGSRALRVTVRVKSPTDLETVCPCPENRGTGALCGHAVAVGLAAIARRSSPPAAPATAPQPQSQKPSSPVAVANLAWQILLPLNWRDAFLRAKMAATLASRPQEEPAPADDRLNAWLAREKVSTKEILSIHLDSDRIPGFLEAIADHPRIGVGKDQLSISIRSGERFRIESAAKDHGFVEIHPFHHPDPWVEIAGNYWRIAADGVSRVGNGTVPVALQRRLRDLATGQSLRVPLAEFFSQLDAWQEWVVFPEGSWLDSLHFVPAPARIELGLDGSLQHLEAQLKVHYADAPPVPPGLGKVENLPRLMEDRCEVRNPAAEEQAVNRLANSGFQPEDFSNGCWVLKGEGAIQDFIVRHLPELRKIWSVNEGQRFGYARSQIQIVSPKIEIHGSGEDWLSFDLSFQTSDGVSIPSAEVRALLRSGRKAGKGAGGKQLVISNELSDLIDPLFSEIDLHQENGRFTANARSGELIRELCKKISNPLKVSDEDDSYSFLNPFQNPATFHANLRPYQSHGAAWLQNRVERFGGALLADDMGLGKTIQTIALIERLFESLTEDSGVVLVLATASLLGNWAAEFGKFARGERCGSCTVRAATSSGRRCRQGRWCSRVMARLLGILLGISSGITRRWWWMRRASFAIRIPTMPGRWRS